MLGGAHLKKLRRAEGGAKNFGVFRVKNHDFTSKNYIFSNFRGGARNPPPWIRPCIVPLTKILEGINLPCTPKMVEVGVLVFSNEQKLWACVIK